MKVASEKQLEYIKAEFKDLLSNRISEYLFEGVDLNIFENLILFYDDQLFNKIKEEHYLAMSDCERTWNKYFWYLRYSSDTLKYNKNAGSANHPQLIAGILDHLYNTCKQIDELAIEPFSIFATDFEHQKYILFDYFHPCITDTGVSIQSTELLKIVNILDINNFDVDEVDKLITGNIDNEKAELLTFRSKADPELALSIDTFSASEDQIHPANIVIKCKFDQKENVDRLLVSWWSKHWRKMGPFVAVSNTNKFDTEEFFIGRKKVEM